MARASKYDESKRYMLRRILGSQGQSAAPSVREFAQELDIGVATVHSYLSKLAEEGLIEWEQGRHRSLRLTPTGAASIDAPTSVRAS